MTSPKILIVEDEYIIANDIQTSLENIGYNVCGMVASGEKAIKAVKEKQPDLILMDIMLKGEMDGVAAAEIIKSEFDISVIYLSAYSDEEVLKRAKETLPFGYLIKPFRDRELRAAIEMALFKHQIEKEKDQLIKELKAALKKVKVLSGLLPICAHCKKIRNDQGYWSIVEEYIQAHSDAKFSHGICPDCMEELYGHEEWYDEMKEEDNT
jgi:two-component system, response regulator PdtaR